MFHHSHWHLFTDGSRVEISSDDEGFKGAWYLGKILNSSPNNPSPSSVKSKRKRASKVSNLVEVQYESLVSDDNENEPLRELVDVSLLRPVPPSHTVESFALNDVVDAFYRDGWWTGVVTKVLEGSSYRVYFQNPPDFIEFPISDLRPHFDWVDGEWVRPPRQVAKEFYLLPGNDVEVKLDNENPCDVWYLGSIVKEIGNNYYLVAYRSSGTDAAAKTVAVASHIRPYPPCWRYVIFFKHSKTEKEISRSELRPHVDWMNGKWEVQSRSHPEEESNHELNCVEHTQATPRNESLGVIMDNLIVRALSSTSSGKIIVEQPIPGEKISSEMPTVSGKKKMLNATCDSNSTLSRPLKKQKEGNAKAASVTSCRLRKRSLENRVEEVTSDFTTPLKQKAEESTSTDQLSAKTENASQEREGKEQKVGGLDTQMKETPRKRGRPRKSLETPSVKVSNNSGQAAKGIGGKEHGISGGGVPIIIGLASNTMKRPQAGNSYESPHEESPGHKYKKQQIGRTKKQDSHKIELHQDGVRSQLRRRGRKPKLPVMFLQVLEKAGVTAGKGVEKGSATNLSELTPSTGLESPGMRSAPSLPIEDSSKLVKDQKPTNGPAQNRALVTSRTRTPRTKKERMGKETLGQIFGKQLQKTSLKRGKSDGPSKNINPETQGSQDASKEKIPEAETDLTLKEAHVDADRKSITASVDDRPLSMWISGSDAQLPLKDPGHEEIFRHLALVDVGREDVIDDFQGLPFLKGSSIWTTIESMPIFKKMPQRPHFRPLQNFKEEHREGLAIGNMVTFATLVEKITKLQFDDPKSVFDSSLGALLDLETHGFDVKVVRGRINEMLAFKDKQSQLLDKSKDFQSQIMELIHEKKRIDDEIDEIDQKLRELQEQRASSVSKKESKDLDIAHLQTSVDVICKGIQNARDEFQKLAAAPW